MNARLKRILEASVPHSLVRAVRAQKGRGSLTVLAYHGVPTAGALDRQLGLLGEMCHFVDLDTVLEALETRSALPDEATLVTFDDAERSVFENGQPVLDRHGIRAVMFPVADLIGTDRPFWWTEARWLFERGCAPPELASATGSEAIRRLQRVPDSDRRSILDAMRERSSEPPPRYPHLEEDELLTWLEGGHDIGNHTLTHPCLPRCTLREMRSEVAGAHEVLRRISGREPRVFAYPNGDVCDVSARIVGEQGYRLALTFDHRLAEWPPSDPLRVSRVRVNVDDTLDRLALSVSGLHPMLHSLRTRARSAVSR